MVMSSSLDMSSAEKGGKLITVDCGNTFVKVAVWQGGVITGRMESRDIDFDSLSELIGDGPVRGAVYCSVGKADARLLETLRILAGGELLILGPSTRVPLGIRYRTPETLGLDRVAAACGAAAVWPGTGILVVDAGTAVTLDVVTPDGCFAGGNIAPGMSLRFSSLHDHTSRLPLVDSCGEVLAFGSDTETAIRAGVIGGMVAQIADSFREARSLGVEVVALGGGDAAMLFPMLVEKGVPCRLMEDMVARGLFEIFEYN